MFAPKTLFYLERRELWSNAIKFWRELFIRQWDLFLCDHIFSVSDDLLYWWFTYFLLISVLLWLTASPPNSCLQWKIPGWGPPWATWPIQYRLTFWLLLLLKFLSRNFPMLLSNPQRPVLIVTLIPCFPFVDITLIVLTPAPLVNMISRTVILFCPALK